MHTAPNGERTVKIPQFTIHHPTLENKRNSVSGMAVQWNMKKVLLLRLKSHTARARVNVCVRACILPFPLVQDESRVRFRRCGWLGLQTYSRSAVSCLSLSSHNNLLWGADTKSVLKILTITVRGVWSLFLFSLSKRGPSAVPFERVPDHVGEGSVRELCPHALCYAGIKPSKTLKTKTSVWAVA